VASIALLLEEFKKLLLGTSDAPDDVGLSMGFRMDWGAATFTDFLLLLERDLSFLDVLFEGLPNPGEGEFDELLILLELELDIQGIIVRKMRIS
jgi:hypothetical protein